VPPARERLKSTQSCRSLPSIAMAARDPKQTIGLQTSRQGRTGWQKELGSNVQSPVAGGCFPRPAARVGASATVSFEVAATKSLPRRR